MNRTIFIVLVIAVSFCFGFAFKSIINPKYNDKRSMKKVTGIGGIFFKCKDPKKMNEWYKTHLGLNTTDYGATFRWREDTDPEKKGATQWSTFSETTKYFEPSAKEFMINYRVDDLEALVAQLKNEGVTVVDKIEDSDYGKFVHIMDAEGNKVELWEPTEKN